MYYSLTRVKIIVNPISGKGLALRMLVCAEGLLKRKRIIFDITKTSRAGDAKLSAAELADYDAVIGIGGDGTINEIISGMLAKPKPLLIVPTGTGNVIAKEIGMYSSAHYMEKLITDPVVRWLDAGICDNGRCFISMLGAGFDASVVREFHSLRKGGTTSHIMQYLPSALHNALRYRFPRIMIKADGHVITKSAGFVQVANVRSYGGPFSFAPCAVPDDGLMDIVWFNGKNFPGVLKLFLGAFLKDPLVHAGARTVRAGKIELSSVEEVPVQIDGDPAGCLPVSITVRHNAVPLLVNRNLRFKI